jgi:hypothetical protein
MTAEERVLRLAEHGYNPIHIIGPLYLVRNYSCRAQKWSLYGFMIIK